MRNFIVAAALVAAGTAFADSEFRQGADYVRVTARPCVDPAVLSHIEKAGESSLDYRAASAEVGGQSFAGCWKPMFPQGAIYIRYSDGDQGLIPFDAMKPVREV